MKIAFLVPDNRDEFRRYADPEPYFGPAPTALLEGFEQLSAECEVHIVCCVQRSLRAPARIGRNLYYHALPVGKWGWLRGGYAGCIAAIRRRLREIQPDIVHGQGTERFPAIAAAFSGFPNVVTIHGNMRNIARVNRAKPLSFQALTARLEALTLPRTGGVVCNSVHTETLVRPVARRTWRVPNALRSAFLGVPAHGAGTPRPLLLNIGVISPLKRQLELLKMAERLWREGCSCELHFIGDVDCRSNYGAAFASAIDEAEARGYARYLGSKGLEDIVKALDAASALIHCPREEAFGLVVAEALARNLKVFGSRVGGIIDIASGAEGAELFEMDDWEKLGDAVRRWVAAGSQRPANASAEMRRRYDPEQVARQHLTIYEEMLQPPYPPRAKS